MYDSLDAVHTLVPNNKRWQLTDIPEVIEGSDTSDEDIITVTEEQMKSE